MMPQLRFLRQTITQQHPTCALSANTVAMPQSSKHLMQWFLWKYFNTPEEEAAVQDVQLSSSFHSTNNSSVAI